LFESLMIFSWFEAVGHNSDDLRWSERKTCVQLFITNASEIEVDDLEVHVCPPFKDEARLRRLGT